MTVKTLVNIFESALSAWLSTVFEDSSLCRSSDTMKFNYEFSSRNVNWKRFLLVLVTVRFTHN